MKNTNSAKITNMVTLALGIVNTIAAVPAILSLPEKVPTHFDAKYVCDGIGSRWSLLVIAVIPLIMSLILTIPIKLSMKQQPKVLAITSLVCTLFFCAVFWLLYPIAASDIQIGDKLDKSPFTAFLPMLFSAMFIVLGNYMPVVKHNRFFGFRIKWTLDNPQCWKVTHRFMGKLMVITGVISFIISIAFCAFGITNIIVEIVTVLLMNAITIVFSTLYAYKHKSDKLLSK